MCFFLEDRLQVQVEEVAVQRFAHVRHGGVSRAEFYVQTVRHW